MGRTNRADDVFYKIDTHGNDPTVCWEWTGSIGGRDGRGYFTLDGRKQLVYRIVYELFHPGELKEGQVVRHECDNPICCNPFHLIRGTRSENELDKYERDRAGYPRDVVIEIHRLAKLNMIDRLIVEEIEKKFGIRISRSGVQKVRVGDSRAAVMRKKK
ncbi:MAG: HNH endonuclease [Gammaproteobacteria bacterium]|uniref:Putative homing endonuclease n=1 Tax=viral metagenome TaxID=1070528 RepID=A0A6H1ZAY2_9ZZZZ|nr:HNH endonuclease [Gammaproteobacteria bacterium]